MGSIPPDAELGKEQGRVLRDVMPVTVINVNSVVRRLDAEIGVFDLRSHLGNASVTVVPVGHGEASPIASNATSSGRKQNRRVTITLPKP